MCAALPMGAMWCAHRTRADTARPCLWIHTISCCSCSTRWLCMRQRHTPRPRQMPRLPSLQPWAPARRIRPTTTCHQPRPLSSRFSSTRLVKRKIKIGMIRLRRRSRLSTALSSRHEEAYSCPKHTYSLVNCWRWSLPSGRYFLKAFFGLRSVA